MPRRKPGPGRPRNPDALRRGSRLHILIPDELLERVRDRATLRGVSLGQHVREVLERDTGLLPTIRR